MTADVTAQDLMGNVGAAMRGKDFRYRAADVGLRVDEGTVDVEHVDRECRDHKGASLKPAAGRLRAYRGGAAAVPV